MAAIWKGVESLKRSWTFFAKTFPYTETSPEMTSYSGSFKSNSSNIVKSAMRTSKKRGYPPSSTGGGSSGDVVAFPFLLPTMGTNRGNMPRGLLLSLYFPREGGRSLLLNATTVLQGKTPFILNCGDSSPRGLSGGLPWPRDKGSSPSLGRPLRSRPLPQLRHAFRLQLLRPLQPSLQVTMGRRGEQEVFTNGHLLGLLRGLGLDRLLNSGEKAT